VNLRGARVVLTGASRGIGAAVAPALAAEGARLVLVARDGTRLLAVATACQAAGGEVRVVAGDVAEPATAARAVAAAREAWGGVDGLINNAAILTPVRDLADTPLADFRRVLEVNVLGAIAGMQAVWPLLRAQGAGWIVNLSSGWGRHADAGVTPYCASKFAIEAVSQGAAAEAPPGVCVVAVSPGVVHTDMLVTAFGGPEAAQAPTPEQFAPRFVRFLAKLSAGDNGRSLSVP
jgi:NAD(P)-dependent dehydrogenase (short-subunit alcohol dehydrogenase family)